MKFIHLADCHLADKSSFSDDLGSLIRKKSWESFENIFLNNKDVDFALIAGDLFERQYFSPRDFDRLFRIFENFKKDIYYVSGNHDYFDDYNRIFLNQKPSNLYIFTKESLSLFEKDKLRIYGLSYKDRIYNKDFPYDIKLDDRYFNILLAHGVLGEDKSNYLNLDREKLDNMGFNYIGLGHIHKSYSFSNIYYPGSIEPHDFTDIYDYGYIRYDNGKVSFIDSSLLKFKVLDIYPRDFSSIDEMASFIDEKLSDRINFLRLNIKEESDFSILALKNKINAEFVEINYDYKENFDEILNLYPDSLLTDFNDILKNKDDEIALMAREIGLEAIFRSKKWRY